MKNEPIELPLEETENFLIFYVVVNYYQGRRPFCIVVQDIANYSARYDKVFKIKVPLKEV